MADHVVSGQSTTWTTCSVCGKQSFASRRAAKAMAKRRHPAAHLSVYQCDDGGWHYGNLPPLISRGVQERWPGRRY